MKIGIVGWGVEGQSIYRFFGPGHDYLIVNEEPRDDFPDESEKIKVQFVNEARTPGITGNVADLSYLKGLEDCDQIIYTPTSYKNLQEKFGQDQGLWAKTTTVQHIFFETVKTKNIVGVTGSKGKGTTSTLIAKMLEAEGKNVYLGGNIGRSVLDFVRDVEPDDWVVLELSNFQLIDFPYSSHIAVCLMITEEHQDWHTDVEEYIKAKANLFKHQKPEDVAIYFAQDENSKSIAAYSPGKKLPYFEKPGAFVREDGMIVIGDDERVLINKSEVKLLGGHNLQNICAACTAVFEAIGSLDKAKAVLYSFTGLEHRLELVRTLQGVKYYDDSFATTPDSTIVALKAFKEPKVLIVGGHDKGLNFDPAISEVLSSNVRHIITIGDIGPKIAKALADKGYKNITQGLKTMAEIVDESRRHAQSGDVVLLSCGTSSFGMFKDYKDRGNQFKEAVQALA